MGIFIAIAVMAAWAAHLWYILTAVEVAPDNPWMYAHLIVQAYFYTGLFITGHDAMHGVVAPKNLAEIIW
jgi:beta-carotene ketolase (CrtW type)